ncbi:MAG: hypothetical protein FWG14_00015 [Peptococcaceae bacterium]|nr:hypothetical protein [Peptococcaceae bacterium]
MNIIRTTAVELTAIPAIAYKQKLYSGGAGIKIYRLDQDVSTVFTIDRRTGEGIPYGKYDADLFPDEAVNEALELTIGLPYTSRGKFKISVFEEAPDQVEGQEAVQEDVAETETEKVDMVNSEEYKALIDRYTNEKGKINYTLMNKDFIQFASRSKVVENRVAEKASLEDILIFIVKSRSAHLAGKKDSLSDQETTALIETLDEIDPRSAFKELTLHIRRLLAKNSR